MVLIGFMGAGKSTVGRALAGRLGWNFYDLDELIERREQCSVAVIFSQSGEKTFREIESAVLQDLLQDADHLCVVALGGGAFVQAGNREALERAEAITVLLSAPIEELRRRCEAEGRDRPLARDASQFERLFAAREEAYARARFRVETLDKHPGQVADEIQNILKIAIEQPDPPK